MARACLKEARAAIAVAKAIVCSSMETRRPFDRNERSNGNARAQRRTDIPVRGRNRWQITGDGKSARAAWRRRDMC